MNIYREIEELSYKTAEKINRMMHTAIAMVIVNIVIVVIGIAVALK